jgi:hypothetical protein
MPRKFFPENVVIEYVPIFVHRIIDPHARTSTVGEQSCIPTYHCRDFKPKGLFINT